MPKPTLKTLPKDFREQLEAGDIAALKAVFDRRLPDARGGYGKQTALAFDECPAELTRWLVEERGADLDARNGYGETPLIARASSWRENIASLLALGADVNAIDSRGNNALHGAAAGGRIKAIQLLLEAGTDPSVRNKSGKNPLEYALARCSNIKIERMVPTAKLLLAAMGGDSGDSGTDQAAPSGGGFWRKLFGSGGAKERSPITPEMRAAVERIGADFEFHRAGFNTDYVQETSDALDELYALFGATPAPRRHMHDGVSPIRAKAGPWINQYAELWDLLVPSGGAAASVQGEVVRIAGRIHDENYRNGGANWDDGYRKMGAAFIAHLGSGTPLAEGDIKQAAAIVKSARHSDDTDKLREYATHWVALNPDPVELPPPDYDR